MRHQDSVRRLAIAVALALVCSFGTFQPSPASAEPIPAGTADLVELAIPAGATGTVGVQRIVAALPATTTKAFSMVGLTWDAADGSAPTLQVRGQQGSAWTNWITLEIDAASSVGRQGTEPAVLGASTGLEVRALGDSTTRLTGLRATLLNPAQQAGDTTTRSVLALASGSGYLSQPPIVSRLQWGADESLLKYNGSSCVPANLDKTVKAAVVHHTAGTNNYTAAQAPGIVRGIYEYHVKSRGWCDVGYNFLIDKFGVIYEGRHGGVTLPVHGAHAGSWNTTTVGISFMMDSTYVPATSAALNSAAQVVAWKLAGNYRDPLAQVYLVDGNRPTIMGHGQVMSTDCPGTTLTAALPTFRQSVASRMGNWKTPIYRRWQAAGGPTTMGEPLSLESDHVGGRLTVFNNGRIYMNPAGATFLMGGRIGDLYARLGGASSRLGWPIASQTTGVASEGRVDFARGAIYYSGATGAHSVGDEIYRYLTTHPSAAAALGLPTGEEQRRADGTVSQTFQYGRVTLASSVVSVSVGASPGDVVGDQDGDRLSDLTMINTTTHALSWSRARSGATFGTPTVTSTGWAGFNWISQVPDVTGDGRFDLIGRRSDSSLWLFRGTGRGGYLSPTRVGWGFGTMRDMIVVPDMGGDRSPDLVGIAADGTLWRYDIGQTWLTNATQLSGTGAFRNSVRLGSVGDFNADRVTDFFAVNSAGQLTAYFTQGLQIVGQATIGRGWSAFLQLSSGDVNGDGQLDLVGRNANGTIYVYPNMGTRLGTTVVALRGTAGYRQSA